MRRWIAPLVLGLVLAVTGYLVEMTAYPKLLMWGATRLVAKSAGYNTMFPGDLPSDTARAIVRPSPDIAYSTCPFDVSKGPVLVDVEPVPSPYWSLSVFDHRTDVAYVRNNLDAAGQPIRIAIAAEGQPVPDGMQAVRVSGTTGIALLRILVQDRSQFAPIDAARRKSSCRPLS